jgi:hypothetical protein
MSNASGIASGPASMAVVLTSPNCAISNAPVFPANIKASSSSEYTLEALAVACESVDTEDDLATPLRSLPVPEYESPSLYDREYDPLSLYESEYEREYESSSSPLRESYEREDE